MNDKKITFDPILYAAILEAALRERDAWDAGTLIEAQRLQHVIGGAEAEIVISVRRVV